MEDVGAAYVAIIPDGNARWARKQGLPVLAGHSAGADTIRQVVRDAKDLGIKELTVWSFSTENWNRPDDEVAGLMALFSERIKREVPELNEQNIRMRFIGRRTGISQELADQIEWAEAETKNNSAMTFCVAFNYGGRAEILDAAAKFKGGSEEDFRACLYAPDMHDPDLIIRTSGEQRISNYLLWQGAYSELHYCDSLWPDFSRADLEAALEDFKARKRRFGGR